jgi:type I restriction enzyme M protein
MPSSKTADTPTTPQARLASVIKRARDIMRKDAGLNGETDRIPQLAWLLFLRAFDAQEAQREVTDRDFRPAIERPYRWRDWAAPQPNGRTGEELLSFVNNELLPYLRGLTGSQEHDPRDVLAAVFKETYNRMLSGYLLRDVIDCVNEIHFESSDDIHTMAFLYETMLREMRDAAGDSGEFYTPRPVIRFIVERVEPRLGESILDPACGTGGFLVEALEHIRPHVENVEQWQQLQGDLHGIEKKPLPYLLGMMNLLLHEVEQPAIVRDNALAHPITEIREMDRVNVVLTNPPFGGEEEKSIQANFPAGTRSSETAVLFLQLVERLLKSKGRCGMVLPNSLLFDEGVTARARERLLRECNLHTVVRLPYGTFAPYTDIPANLLFFDRTSRTKEVWFFEIPAPEGRKKYTKTRPMRFEDFRECQEWWGGSTRQGRVETALAWRVPIVDIEATNFSLDWRNPNRANAQPLRSLADVADDIGHAATRLGSVGRTLAESFVEISHQTTGQPRRLRMEDVAYLDRFEVSVEPTVEYQQAGIYSFGKGLFSRGAMVGAETKYKSLYRLCVGQVVFSRLGAWEGAIAVVNRDFGGFFVSNEFPTFSLDETIVEPRYFHWLCTWPGMWKELEAHTRGVGMRQRRLTPENFLKVQVSLPPLDAQVAVANLLEEAMPSVRDTTNQVASLVDELATTVVELMATGRDLPRRGTSGE